MKKRGSLLVFLFTFTSCLVFLPLTAVHVRAASTDEELSRGIHAMTEALSLVEKNYADPVSTERAIYDGAIPGMLRTLDPHSNFLDPAEYQDMQRKQRAQYFGIGMLIGEDAGKVVAMEPFVGSPAWKADLRRGDVIVAVD